MTFKEYKAVVRKHGHFTVILDDNRMRVGISDEVCKRLFEKWLAPLLAVSQKAYVYETAHSVKNLTPPPKRPRPSAVSKTGARVQLSISIMMAERYWEYWAWALRRRCIILVIPKGKFPVDSLAKEVWDPSILTNLGVGISRATIGLAKREVLNGNTCCIISRDAYGNDATIFAPTLELLKLYEGFVKKCRFTMKGLQQELGS